MDVFFTTCVLDTYNDGTKLVISCPSNRLFAYSFSLQMNGCFLNSGFRKMLKGKDCQAGDRVFSILCAVSDQVAVYKKYSKMTKALAVYMSLMSRGVSLIGKEDKQAKS